MQSRAQNVLAVLVGLLCTQGACSLRSLDYLKNGHKQDGAMIDGAQRDVATPSPPSADTALVEVVSPDSLAYDGTWGTGGDGSGEARADASFRGGAADVGPVGSAAVDGSDDVAIGGAGGDGEVETGAGGSGAAGTEIDATGTATGGGGAAGTGGTWATGGDPSTGDAMGSGGIDATGGTSATGGSTGTGGLIATGGLGATGGVTATGGISATGGVLATGGKAATGGATGTGGSSSIACSGVLYSGICWYWATLGGSCTQACTDHGGPSSLAAGHVGTAAQGGSLSDCATILSLLGAAGPVQNVVSTSGVGCSRNTGTMGPGPGPGLYWCTSPAFSETASLTGIQPACGCLK